MKDLPDIYNLETLEQLRAVSDELRLRILEQLALQAMTVTQLAGVLGEVPAKLHYHVRELEKVGLLKLVETREKGGILEKYYRAVGKTINAPGTLFRGMPPDEAIAALTDITSPFFQGVIHTAQHILRTQAWDDPDQVLYLAPEYYWMTGEEYRQLLQQIESLLKPYKERRGIEREREQALLMVGYTVPPVADQEGTAKTVLSATETPALQPASLEAGKAPRQEMMLLAGVTHYGRVDLEKVLVGGNVLDIYVLGACTFADDIPPDLVERVVHSFHLWGKLTASPEVREVLKQKEGNTRQKHR